MENASKALIIAAGMLIGILIISLFFYEMASVASTAKRHQETMDRTEILEFNAQFEKYANREGLTPQEVVTIFNYIKRWNDDNLATQIEIYPKGFLKDPRNTEDFLEWSNELESGKYNFQRYYFKLEITEHDEYGRIRKMIITQKVY